MFNWKFIVLPSKCNPSLPSCWNTTISSLSKWSTNHNIGFGICEFIDIFIHLAISGGHKYTTSSNFFILILILLHSYNMFHNIVKTILHELPSQDVKYWRCNKHPNNEHDPRSICQGRCICTIIVRCYRISNIDCMIVIIYWPWKRNCFTSCFSYCECSDS